jgi:poly-gamma-glutamate synthesis protein (capsule biosynthesis protein)
VAVGDMCFASAPGRLVSSRGPKAPFKFTASYLRNADLTLGNLECPLSKRGSRVRGKKFTFRGSPKVVEGLQSAGLDMVALGNNHARDYGSKALVDTLSYLDKGGIKHAGAGKNRSAAFSATYVRSQDTTVAFLSFSLIGPSDFAAGKKRPGTAYASSRKTVTRAIKAAKRRARYVIVSYHWGTEYSNTANSSQVSLAHASVRAGADLVLSHHPHVIQGVEFYRKKLIAYSLGNFVFSPGHEAGHDSMILRLTIGPHGILGVTARPIRIDSNGAPRFATGRTGKRILGIIRKTSRGRGSHVKVSSGVATLKP